MLNLNLKKSRLNFLSRFEIRLQVSNLLAKNEAQKNLTDLGMALTFGKPEKKQNFEINT